MGLFGSDKKTTTTVTEITEAKEQPVQIGGSAGAVVGPEAVVSGGPAIKAGAGSKISAAISMKGLSGGEVQKMLDSVFAEGAAGREAIGGLAQSLSSGLAQQAESVTGALSATRAPEQSALPWLIGGLAVVVVLMAWSK